MSKAVEFLVKKTDPKTIFTYEDFDEGQMMMYNATKDFIEQEILPNIDKIEKQEGTIVEDLLRSAGEMGLLGITVPENLNGLNMSFNTSMLINSKLLEL